MWVLLEPSDAALVPAPSYLIHIHGPILAGASIFQVPMGHDEDLFANQAGRLARPRPRVIVLSFPHNPTTATVELDFMGAWSRSRASTSRRRARLRVRRPRVRRSRAAVDPAGAGADEVAVELYTLTKSFSMAGWRVGFLVGNLRLVGALARLKSWLDYGTSSRS